MILVNLLPHREESRKRRKQAFNALLVMSAIAGVALGGLGWFYYNLRIGVQEDVNSFIAAENAQLAIKIKDVEGVEAEIAALRERQKAVESLQQERNDPVKLFNELSAKMPDGLFLTSIKQTDEQVVVQGIAQTNERVSEFLRNLRDSEILAKSPQLDETIVQDVTLSNKNNKSRAYSFKMVLTLKKPEKTEPKKVSTAGAA
ncbi:MAG: PilN domain-containing protein [Brachymonas sp.]|jgi:type IV pilus assembly protein PilN|nr:PilN domain-containing protein [Brachymonas sp.]MBP7739922.1 PilN domain-containing protein [Brachymonas sp.]MBP8596370.1 PilN domain-containing protein [Brachymonas sp.]MBP8746750.1 PilN domain-containing protein [Brachymonas sp.]MBP9589728.1 PilN domain-containing protein [Brachymonas sp.]